MNIHLEKILKIKRPSLHNVRAEELNDRRHFRHCLIFDPTSRAGARKRSNSILLRAKVIVSHYLLHLQDLMKKNEAHGFEEAWFSASNANQLIFDFEFMFYAVLAAEYGDLSEELCATCDGSKIVVNGNFAFTTNLLAQTLLHESFHFSVYPPGEKLSGDVEHLALALLGDRGEQTHLEDLWERTR